MFIPSNTSKVTDLQKQLDYAKTQKGPFWRRQAVILQAQIHSLMGY